MGLFFKGQKLLEVQIKKRSHRQIMVGESNQNVILIQTDALSFAEFEISEFEIARVDCIGKVGFI